MANRFENWVENNVENSTQNYSTFHNDSQRQAGFQSGQSASSIRVNSALRQANLVACALMDVVAPNDQILDLQSSREDVAEAIRQGISGKKINSQTYTGVKSSQPSITINIPVATSSNPNTPADFFLQVGKHYRFKGYFDFSDVDLSEFTIYGLPLTDEHYDFSVDLFTYFEMVDQQSWYDSDLYHKMVMSYNNSTLKGFVIYPATSDPAKLEINHCELVNNIGKFKLSSGIQPVSGYDPDGPYYIHTYRFEIVPDRNSSNEGKFPDNLKAVLTDVIQLD